MGEFDFSISHGDCRDFAVDSEFPKLPSRLLK